MSSSNDGPYSAWRIEALLAFPVRLIAQVGSKAGEPVQLHESRIPTTTSVSAGIAIQLQPSKAFQKIDRWLDREPASLVLWTVARSDKEALNRVERLLDLVVDDLSFQLQEPLPIKQLEILKVAKDTVVDTECEAWLFPYPDGYQQYKAARNVAWGTTVQTERFPKLRPHYAALPQRLQDALDWYLKGLRADSDADRFIGFWISVEIMRNESNIKVTEPTRLRCGHSLPQCPDCQKPTDTYRQAATTTKFLEAVGISNEISKRLWSMRQIVHGAKSFDDKLLTELGDLVQYAQAAAVVCLKAFLGNNDPMPAVVGIAATAPRGITLLIKRKVATTDLDRMPQHIAIELSSKEQDGQKLFASLCKLGVELRAAGDLKGSEDALRQLVGVADGDAADAGYANLGVTFLMQGKAEEGMQALQKAIEGGGRFAASAANNLAVYYMDQGRFEEASATLEPFAQNADIERATERAEVGGKAALMDGDRPGARLAFQIAILTANEVRRGKFAQVLRDLDEDVSG